MLNLPEIIGKGFSLTVLSDNRSPSVKFSGNGDSEAIEAVDRFLKALNKQLLVGGQLSVSVNLTELYFMNSSCLKAFVAWIYGVNEAGRPYKIHLLTNPRLHWQKRSLETLKRLAPEVVKIEEVDSIPPEAAPDALKRR